MERNGRTAVVTDAASGIGRGLARDGLRAAPQGLETPPQGTASTPCKGLGGGMSASNGRGLTFMSDRQCDLRKDQTSSGRRPAVRDCMRLD